MILVTKTFFWNKAEYSVTYLFGIIPISRRYRRQDVTAVRVVRQHTGQETNLSNLLKGVVFRPKVSRDTAPQDA